MLKMTAKKWQPDRVMKDEFKAGPFVKHGGNGRREWWNTLPPNVMVNSKCHTSLCGVSK
jgi:hypothetical protein